MSANMPGGGYGDARSLRAAGPAAKSRIPLLPWRKRKALISILGWSAAQVLRPCWNRSEQGRKCHQSERRNREL